MALLKLIQEQDEYFMNTWPQVFEHVFLCLWRNTGTNHRLINFIRSKGAYYIPIYNQRVRGTTAGTVQDGNEAEISVFGRKAAQC